MKQPSASIFQATVCIDGGTGWRSGEAPLKENLAAAILLRAGWPAIAAAGGTLADPMCGSGTLLIEGAWLAGDVAPGLLRDYFGFLGWKQFDPAPWREMVQEARERREEGLRSLPPIHGYDSDAKAIATARNNIRRAGLAGRVMVERRGLDHLTAPISGQSRGLLVTNPPYGKRLGEVQALVPTYETLGEKLKESFGGWEAAVFTGNIDLGVHLGLRAHRMNTFYNGPLECKLLLFHIGTDAFRGSPAREPGGGAEMLANRLRKNQKHLRAWLTREDVHCYRVYDADLPEYALAIDLYDGRAHVQEYAAPDTVDPVRARRRLRAAMEVIPDALGVAPEDVTLKVRRPQRGPEQYQRLATEGHFFEVQEGGLRFLVNLTDYLDTGLFLDHRITRSLIRDLAPGRRFLNLFAYTGSATVYAAAGGAVSTTTMDMSSTYLEWARRNLALNHLDGPQHRFDRVDCVQWLESGSGKAGGYDLIFMDAPTFSNSKGMEETLSIQRDHPRLVRAAARLLSEDGVLLFATNFRKFRLDVGLQQDFEVRDISKQTLAPDFLRNPRIHRTFRITRIQSQSSSRRRMTISDRSASQQPQTARAI